ncbi:MAG: DnaJ domain-containing protein [Chloroflexi bacterium]|nr:DnaJ domain-containing protein [Chloroflexota bacterium]
MANKDYYAILGVSRNASDQQIKEAYRKLARKHHPDVNSGDKSAEEKFKKINEAYEVLSNKESRQKYDLYGDQWQHAEQFARAGAGAGPRTGTYRGGAGPFDFENVFTDSIFEEMLKGARPHRAARGEDVEYPVEVSLEEAYSGVTRNISFQVEEPCPRCQGRGWSRNQPCPACGGGGSALRMERLEVKIPAGVTTGSRVRIAGKGTRGNGAPGDLYLVVTLRPHPVFERHGANLHVSVPLPLTVAVLGGEAEVPTPGGKLMLKVPPETQNGSIFRLAGRGMPHPGSPSRGDILARVNVVLPTGLSQQERELFQQLAGLRSEGDGK